MNRDMLSRRLISTRLGLMLLVWAGWIVVEGSLLKLEYWQHATAHLQSSGAEGVSRAEVELVD